MGNEETRFLTPKVDQVQIYLNGAVITRTGQVELKKGMSTIYLTGPSYSADADSVRMRFFGNAGVRSLNIRRMSDIKEKWTEDNKAQDEAAALEKESARIDRRIKRLKESKKRWEDCAISNVGNIKAEDMISFIEHINQHIDDIDSAVEEHEKEKEALLAHRKEMQKEEDNQRVVTADVWASQDGVYAFEMLYREQEVYWKPGYDIMIDALNKPLRLVLRGNIFQNTGEKWEQVKVKLFTGNPNARNECPVQQVQFLGFQPSGPGVNFRIRDSFNPPYPADYGDSGETTVLGTAFLDKGETIGTSVLSGIQSKEAFRPAKTDINTQVTMTAYTLPDQWDIDSNNRGNSVEIETRLLDVSYFCSGVPRLIPEMYLTAELTNKQQMNMLSGKASVYYDNNYIGEVSLTDQNEGEPIQIPVGKDGQVTVSHKNTVKHTLTGFIRGQITENYEYEISVTNHKPGAISIRLFDQIPIASNNKISVECTKKDGAELDGETGELCWKYILESNETKVVRFAYNITYPKGERLYHYYV